MKDGFCEECGETLDRCACPGNPLARTCRCGFDKRCADALADEVAALITRRVLDPRSAAGDALLDYRDPPRTPRSDRLAELERDLRAAVDRWQKLEGSR